MSRGGALLRLGRIAEAQAALSGQLEAPMPMQCRAMCRALLAEASAAQGDREAARTWFDEAMRLLPAPQVLLRTYVQRRRTAAGL